MGLFRLVLTIILATIGVFLMLAEAEDLMTLVVIKAVGILSLGACSLVVKKQIKSER